MTTLDDLPTPSLVVEQARLMRNLERMRAVTQRLGVTLRPHLKTAKSAHIAQLAVDPRATRNYGIDSA